MRKRILIIIMPILFLSFNTLFSQITVTNEGQMIILDDQIFRVNGHFVNKSSFFTNRGDFSLTGNFWNEAKVTNPGYGILRFVGVQEQTFFLYDSIAVFDLEIDNSSGLSFTGDFNLDTYGETNFEDGIIYTFSNSLLAFQPGSGYDNASDFSHVNGPVIKRGIDDFLFPVGKGGLLRESGIENLTDTATFLSEYFNFSFSDLERDETLVRVSDEEYWEIERINGSTTANVVLTYEDGIGGFDDINDVRIAYYDNPWTRVQSVYEASSPVFFVSTNAVNKFGYFTFAQNELPQPAIVFEVFQTDDCASELTWMVPPTSSIETFEIEISFDSLNFTKIGEVAGDSIPYTDFEVLQYTDFELYDEERLFYRLKMIQPSGAVYYSETIGIENECIFKHCSLFPNPVSSKKNVFLRMSSQFEQTLNVRVYDVPGRILHEQVIEIRPGNNVYEIYTDSYNLASGMYFLQITPRKSLKFVVIYD